MRFLYVLAVQKLWMQLVVNSLVCNYLYLWNLLFCVQGFVSIFQVRWEIGDNSKFIINSSYETSTFIKILFKYFCRNIPTSDCLRYIEAFYHLFNIITRNRGKFKYFISFYIFCYFDNARVFFIFLNGCEDRIINVLRVAYISIIFLDTQVSGDKIFMEYFSNF